MIVVGGRRRSRGGENISAPQRASSADDVVDAIHRAATDRDPRLRYLVGLLGHLAGTERILPGRLVDAAMGLLSREG